MNFAAIKHESLLLFRQPVARNKVRFRLLTARDDLSECRMIYWKRFEPGRRRSCSGRRIRLPPNGWRK